MSGAAEKFRHRYAGISLRSVHRLFPDRKRPVAYLCNIVVARHRAGCPLLADEVGIHVLSGFQRSGNGEGNHESPIVDGAVDAWGAYQTVVVDKSDVRTDCLLCRFFPLLPVDNISRNGIDCLSRTLDFAESKCRLVKSEARTMGLLPTRFCSGFLMLYHPLDIPVVFMRLIHEVDTVARSSPQRIRKIFVRFIVSFA